MAREPHLSDVSDDEWAFMAPYLILMTEDAPQREYPLREMFNRLRWLQAGVFEALVNDLCQLLRVTAGRKEQPSAAIFDSRTLQSSPKSGVRSGHIGNQPLEKTAEQGIRLEVVKLSTAKKGFVLLPRCWVVERSFAWTARFLRLARDYECLPETLAGLRFLAFAILLLHRLIHLVVHYF